METVFGKFYERIDKPFLITYVTAFVVFHWQFFYVLFTIYVPVPSGTNRLDFALTYFTQYGIYSYLTPFLIALLIILVIPFLNFATVWISAWFNGLEKTHISKKDADLYRDNLNNIHSIKLSEQRKLDQLNKIEQLIKDKFSIVEKMQKPEIKAEEFYRSLDRDEKKEIAKILLILGDLDFRNYQLTNELVESKDGFLRLTDLAKDFLKLFHEEDKGKTKFLIVKDK